MFKQNLKEPKESSPQAVQIGSRVRLKSAPTRTGVVVAGPWFVQGMNWWNVRQDSWQYGCHDSGKFGRQPEDDLMVEG